MTPSTVSVTHETRKKLAVMKENLGYNSWDDMLSDIAMYFEDDDNLDAFEAAFPPVEEDAEEDDEDEG